MKEKDRNASPSDNDISNKKGFLITLPSFKRNKKEAESIIQNGSPITRSKAEIKPTANTAKEKPFERDRKAPTNEKTEQKSSIIKGKTEQRNNSAKEKQEQKKEPNGVITREAKEAKKELKKAKYGGKNSAKPKTEKPSSEKQKNEDAKPSEASHASNEAVMSAHAQKSANIAYSAKPPVANQKQNGFRPNTNTLKPNTNTLKPNTNTLKPNTNTLKPNTNTLKTSNNGAIPQKDNISAANTQKPSFGENKPQRQSSNENRQNPPRERNNTPKNNSQNITANGKTEQSRQPQKNMQQNKPFNQNATPKSQKQPKPQGEKVLGEKPQNSTPERQNQKKKQNAPFARNAATQNSPNKPKGADLIENSDISLHSKANSFKQHSKSEPKAMKINSNFVPDTVTEKKMLEEKYANALPLAEQIELDALAAKGLKKEPKPDIIEQRKENKENVIEIVGVRFREAGKIYYFDPNDNILNFGSAVIVETARGSEYGIVLIENRFVPIDTIVPPLKKIERIATEDDKIRHIANKEQEKEAEAIFKEKVALHNLDMNLIHVEYTFDNSKLLFYFTAEGRVDFRELVKDLAMIFRTRIELRQIGVRDEAKLLGGFGVCGRPLCCNTFLGDFAQVSIKMAKDQSISINSSKISGTCGRLMCCLRYENEVYESEGARTPKLNAIVDTPDGRGTVVERNALKGTVKVALDAKPDTHPQVFSRDDVKVIGYKKTAEEDEELKELEKLD